MVVKLSKRGHSIDDQSGIREILETAYGAAGRWTTSASEIADYVRLAEEQLLRDGLARSRMVGTEVSILSAGPTAKAYQYSVIGSKALLRCTRREWRLIKVSRVARYPGQRGDITIRVTTAALETMTAKLQGRYLVQPPARPRETPGASNDK